MRRSIYGADPRGVAFRQQMVVPDLEGNTRNGAAVRTREAFIEQGVLRVLTAYSEEQAQWMQQCLSGFLSQQIQAAYWRRPDLRHCLGDFALFCDEAALSLGLCLACARPRGASSTLCAACSAERQEKERRQEEYRQAQERRQAQKAADDARYREGVCGVFREEHGVFYWDSTYTTCDCDRMWCRGCTTAVSSSALPVTREDCTACGGQGTVVPALMRVPEPRMKRRMEGQEYRYGWCQKCEVCGARSGEDAVLGPLAGLSKQG